MGNGQKLQEEYSLRFSGLEEYRRGVWKILCNDIFQKYVPQDSKVLDIGSGYGEFITNIKAKEKYAVHLNPNRKKYLTDDIKLLNQHCSAKWPVEDNSIDVIFSSNFLEHLFEKEQVENTLSEAYRCLKPNGKIILIGPNIRFLADQYWDFWDHHIAISDRSIEELLKLKSFKINFNIPKFLPYSMSDGKQPPLVFLKIYLRLRFAWKFFGKQFFVMATK